jgi:hypothetical protein
VWNNAAPWGGPVTITTGSCGEYDSNAGYFYFNLGGTPNMQRFHPVKRYCENWAQLFYAQSTVAVGHRMACNGVKDGTTQLPFVNILGSSQTNFFQCLVSR